MSKKNREQRSAIQVYSDIEDVKVYLSTLPSILQLVIESFHLDNTDITDDDIRDYMARREDLYNSIFLVQTTIYDCIEKIRNISVWNDSDVPTESEV